MSDKTIPEYIYEKIPDLVSKYKTPLQLYDGDGIKKRVDNFIKTFHNNGINKFKNYFAVKALPNHHILKLLLENEYIGLDCSSICELMIAQKLDISPNNIIYTSNYQSDDDLLFAIKYGVIINIDNETYIDTINDLCFKYNITFPKNIYLRINPDLGNTNTETKSNILGGSESKFGISPDKIIDTYNKALSYGAEYLGMHIMTGSGVLDLTHFKNLVEIFENLIKLCLDNDIIINCINLGGGIGIPYKPDDDQIDINEVSKIISKLLKYTDNISMENGRYITCEYGWLITKINNIKTNDDKIFYGCDACMSNLMRPGMYNAYHHISIFNKKEDLISVNVVGGLCENNDWFAKNRLLPKANKNDLLIIHDTGAHSHSMGFQYNGKLRAPEILYNNDDFKLIRRRETFEDYISTII